MANEATNTTTASAGTEIGNGQTTTATAKNIQAQEKAVAGSAKPAVQGKDAEGRPDANLTKEEIRELSEQDLDAYVTKKVNGKAERVKVRDLLKSAQIQEATEKRYEQLKKSAAEANQYKFQLEQLAHVAKNNPEHFLRQVGVDPENFAEATLANKLKMLEMSPEARENLRLKQENETFKKKLQDDENQKKLTAQQQVEAELSQRVDQEITEAFKASGLPKTRYYATRIPYLMMVSEKLAKKGEGEALTAQAAADKVKEEFLGEVKEIFTGMDVNQIREILGDKVKELRDADIAMLQNQGQKKQEKAVSTPTKPKEKKIFTKDDDYRQWIDSLRA